MRLDYNLIKKCIIRACKQVSPVTLDFKVNAEKLNEFVEPYGLIYLNNDLTSRFVMPSDVPLISEYFKKQKLSWFNRSRQFVTTSFVVAESLDERGRKIIADLYDKNRIDDPNFDRVEAVADILADYPCYNAVVVAYRSDDPNRLGKNSYTIIIRANVNVISSPDYEYNNEDI